MEEIHKALDFLRSKPRGWLVRRLGNGWRKTTVKGGFVPVLSRYNLRNIIRKIDQLLFKRKFLGEIKTKNGDFAEDNESYVLGQFHYKISPRSTKLSISVKPQPSILHKLFLNTCLHEIAHLLNLVIHGIKKQKHGRSWMKIFALLSGKTYGQVFKEHYIRMQNRLSKRAPKNFHLLLKQALQC